MPLIKIFQDSKGPGNCRSCHAAITWAETIRGKRMPFDGEIVAVKTEGSPIAGRVVEVIDTDVTMPHWATCSEPERWRR